MIIIPNIAQVKPLHDFVLVLVDERKVKTDSGLLYIPPEGQQRLTSGTVIKTGAGFTLPNGRKTPVPLERGQRVRFDALKGVDLECVGREYSLVAVEHVLAVEVDI